MAKYVSEMRMKGTDIPEVPVGTLVYAPYGAQNPGKVIEDLGYEEVDGRAHYRLVRVKWSNETETTISAAELNDFSALIEDHKKKLRRHIKLKNKLEEMK